MLYLTRKLGESLVINDEIEVTLVEVKGKSAKLGLTFPRHATVLRREVYDRIQEENRAAAAASADAFAIATQGALGAVSTAGKAPADGPPPADKHADAPDGDDT